MEKEIVKKYIYAFLTGCLAKFCFWKYYAIFFMPCVMFYVLLHLLKNSNVKTSFIIGYFFGIGYFLSSISWLYLSFQYYDMITTGILSTILLSLYLAIYPAISCIFYKNKLIFSLAWTVCEILRGVLFSGFPWNLIGYTFMDTPYLPQIAYIITAYGLSFFVVLIAVVNIRWKITLTTTLLLFGIYREHFVPDNTQLQNCKIVIVQPSIPQIDKMNARLAYANLKYHLDLSDFESKDDKTTLIIWPEAAFQLQTSIVEYIAKNIKNNNIHLIAGVDIHENNKMFNSIVVIGKNGIETRYDKKHLVPFGEFSPQFLSKIGIKNIASELSYTSGNNIRLINVDGIPAITPIICYESVFPKCITEGKSSIIINITNDAWFDSKYSDEMVQHLRIVRCRAIEENQPVIRCANSGISCIINSRGRVIKSLPPHTIGILNHTF